MVVHGQVVVVAMVDLAINDRSKVFDLFFFFFFPLNLHIDNP